MSERRLPMRYIAWCLLALLAACARAPEGAVDLAGRAWRVKAGFDAHDLAAARLRGGESVRPPILLGKRKPDTFGPTRSYTVAVTFDAAELPGKSNLYGLYVPQVGQAAELFLNGRHLAGEVRIARDGGLAERRVERSWLVPLPADAVREGVNQLIFHVAGDAPFIPQVPNWVLGFQYGHGYWLGDYDALRPMSDDWRVLLLVGLYVSLGLFALALSALAGGRPLATLGAFALLLGAYTASRSAFVVDWFADTSTLRRFEWASLFLASAAFQYFIRLILDRGARFARVFVAFWAALALLALTAPHSVALFTVNLWQGSILAAFAGTLVLLAQSLRAGGRDVVSFVPALAVLTVTVAWDVVMSLTYVSDLRLAPLGMLLFIGALGINFGVRFFRIHQLAVAADAGLARTQERLTGFYNATLEAICLREGNFVVEVNPAFSRLFGYSGAEAAGRPLTQLFAPESQDGLAAALESGAPKTEALAVRRDGSTFRAELEHRPLAVGERAVIVTAIRDITQRRADEARLRERNQTLEALNQRMVERELRMIDLKREIRALGGGGEAGSPPRDEGRPSGAEGPGRRP